MGMMDPGAAYFRGYRADAWDRAPLLRVDSVELRELLGMGEDQKYVSPLELGEASIQDLHTGKQVSFSTWARRLLRNEPDALSPCEKEAAKLAANFWSYQELRTGQQLELLPVKNSPDQQWISIAHLMRSDFDDRTDPTGGLRKVQEQFRNARAACLADSPEAFNQASAAFLAAVRELGPQLGPYPRRETIDLEVAYNRWMPFSFAWVFTAIAFVCLLLSTLTRWKTLLITGLGAFGAGLVAMLVGFGMRTAISGRAPVTNLYESVVFMGFGTAVLGLVF